MQPGRAVAHTAATAAHVQNVPILSLLRQLVASTTAGTIVNLGGGHIRRRVKVARDHGTRSYTPPMANRRRGTISAWSALAPIASAAAALGCTHGEPPTPPGAPSLALPDLPSAAASPLAPAPVKPPASTRPPAPLSPSASSVPDVAAPPGSALPQTRDKPTASGVAFEARRDALWDAIVNDDPERAMTFFFPLEAYEQVKDVGDPAGDWRRRLVAAYKHDIHALHAKLDGDAADARLVAMTVPGDHATWVDPGEEWNKVGYYRVYGSKLHYTTQARETESFDVKSLISWRGEWFVVHLSAIK
jgi:hypothetical protein